MSSWRLFIYISLAFPFELCYTDIVHIYAQKGLMYFNGHIHNSHTLNLVCDLFGV